jgi:hypothetical protein
MTLKYLYRKVGLGGEERGSPTVSHERAITTADENREAIFSRVAMPHGAP